MILATSLLGAVVGTFVNAICYINPFVTWMYLAELPISLTFSMYCLYVVWRWDGNAKASTLFCALFVVLVLYQYPPINCH